MSQYDPQAGEGYQPTGHAPAQPPRSGGSSVVKWLLIGCFSLLLVMMLVCGIGGYIVYRNAISMGTDLVRGVIVDAIKESDLEEKDKKAIVAQVDRVADEYKAGNISNEQLQKILEELASGPVMMAGMLNVTITKYVEPSGLTDEEKEEAQLIIERVMRGLVEKKITGDEVEVAAQNMFETNAEGKQQLKDNVTDEELKETIAELKTLVDDAGIPNESLEIDIGLEVKKAVDRALGLAPPLSETPAEEVSGDDA